MLLRELSQNSTSVLIVLTGTAASHEEIRQLQGFKPIVKLLDVDDKDTVESALATIEATAAKSGRRGIAVEY